MPVGLLPFIVVGVIIYLTLMPSDGVPHMRFPYSDKVAHALMFGGLSIVLLYDWGRSDGRLTIVKWLISSLVSSALGGIIEYVQDAMDYGRSAEFGDWIADTLGAFLLPLIFISLLRYMIAYSALNLKRLGADNELPDDIEDIYVGSFPEEERRPVDDINALLAERTESYNVSMIFYGAERVGLLTWWQLDHCVYIEHFAISSRFRSKGIGSIALTHFCHEHRNDPIVLEVEPATVSEEARRRISFYERLGFRANPDFGYVQPPYSDGLPPVELMLMTKGTPGPLKEIAVELHSRVYKNNPYFPTAF